MADRNFALFRVMAGPTAWLGVLYEATPARRQLCVTLEDRFRAQKIAGETAIPAGRFRVALRTEGGLHQRYLARFGADFHRGMLWLQAVPGFQFVYLHCGNDADDTEGCVLVGDVLLDHHAQGGPAIRESEAAYRRIYPMLRDAVLAGDTVWLTITDLDTPPGVT